MVAQQKSPVKVPAVVKIPVSMTAEWFDAAVARSFEKDLKVKALGNGRYAMDSSSREGLTYIVTADSCQCDGFQRFHRCYHVARAAFEDKFNEGPDHPAPAAEWPQVAYGIEQHPDGTCAVIEFFIREWGKVARSELGMFAKIEEARFAIEQHCRRQERGPVHRLDCPVCGGWGCDVHGWGCRNCGGAGEVLHPVPSVDELIATGRWPAQPVEQAA